MLDFQALPAGDLEAVGIEAEQFQDGGVNVGDVMPILDGVESQLVGRAVDDAPLDPAAGHPDRESVIVVVAAIGALGAGSSAELRGPDDHGFIEQAATLQVRQKSGDRLVGLGAQGCVVRRRDEWASQAPAAPSPWKTWMKRTPRSERRRAASICWPNGRVTSWSRP